MRVGLIDATDSRELRRQVLRPNLTAADLLPGDELTGGVHLGAVEDDGSVVGTCFVYPEPCYWRADGAGAWRLRQMATASDRQGQGIGAAVLTAALDELRRTGIPLVWCHARERAVPFYARHAFLPHGEIFLDRQHPIPHLRMWRELCAGPTSSG